MLHALTRKAYHKGPFQLILASRLDGLISVQLNPPLNNPIFSLQKPNIMTRSSPAFLLCKRIRSSLHIHFWVYLVRPQFGLKENLCFFPFIQFSFSKTSQRRVQSLGGCDLTVRPLNPFFSAGITMHSCASMIGRSGAEMEDEGSYLLCKSC